MTQYCYRHPDRPTALSCTRCGRSACPECLRPASVGQHCVDCVNQAQQSARATGPVPAAPTAAADAVPYATYGLIGVNVVVFLICLAQAGGTHMVNSSVMRNGALITGAGFDDQYWRLLTSGFLHWSVMHLVINMLSLYIVGRDLERIFGTARYLAIYLISLLGGSGLVMALEGDPTLTAGASGAIYGLMGALLVVVLRLKLSPTTVLIVIGFNLALSIGLPNISLFGHLGGLVFGAASAAAVLWLPTVALPPERCTYREVSRVSWIGLGVLLVVALALGTGFAAATG